MSGIYAVCHKQLGDVLLLQPALETLACHTGTPVHLLTRRGHQALVALMPGVRYCAAIPWRPLPQLIAFDGLNKTAWRAFFAPASKKLLCLREWSEAPPLAKYIFSEVIAPGLGQAYVAEYYWRIFAQEADPTGFRPPRLHPPPPRWKPPCAPQGSYWLLSPASGWKRISWKSGHWAELLDALADGIPGEILVTSAPLAWQRRQAEEVIPHVRRCRARLIPPTSLQHFLWLCANAGAVLTVDGAASHLARAFGVPTLTLFGPTEPANWHLPSPAHCAIRASAGDGGERSMKNLATEEVLAAAKHWLAGLRDQEPGGGWDASTPSLSSSAFTRA